MNQAPIEISCSEVAALLDAGAPLLLVDCREPAEFAIASIRGAQLTPLGQLAEQIAAWGEPDDRTLVIHCHHGGRSLQAALWLRQQGFTAAQSMAGGIDRWSQEIDPEVPRY